MKEKTLKRLAKTYLSKLEGGDRYERNAAKARFAKAFYEHYGEHVWGFTHTKAAAQEILGEQ